MIEEHAAEQLDANVATVESSHSDAIVVFPKKHEHYSLLPVEVFSAMFRKAYIKKLLSSARFGSSALLLLLPFLIRAGNCRRE
jgi:hypothetical protein